MKALIIGVFITLGITVVTFFTLPTRSDSLLVALVGIAISIVIENRVHLGKLRHEFSNELSQRARIDQIHKHGRREPQFVKRLDELHEELSEMATGKCRLLNLSAVYDDDIESINRLSPGEKLLSTCPVSSISNEDRIRQINDQRYIVSIEAHKKAAKRGVKVHHIYLFRSKQDFGPRELVDHLKEIQKTNFIIKVAFRDELKVPAEFDFLVFGKYKVSVGEIDGDSGIVKSGIINIRESNVREYTKQYETIFKLSKRVDEIEAKA